VGIIEVVLRFAIVAVVFAVAMVLLRRYGLSRQRNVRNEGGVLVTGRVTLARGVQLLTVKAGRSSFLVSSGGRVSITPIDHFAAPAPAGTDFAQEAPVGENLSEADSSVAGRETPLLQEPSGRGLSGMVNRWGYRIGLRLRHRFSRTSTPEAGSFAQVLEQFEAGNNMSAPEQSETPPRRSAAAVSTFERGALRPDIESLTVTAPTQPAAPSGSSALSRAALSTPKRRPRPRKNRVPERDKLPRQATNQARVTSEIASEIPNPHQKAAPRARKSPRTTKKNVAPKSEQTTSDPDRLAPPLVKGTRRAKKAAGVTERQAAAPPTVPAPRRDVSDPLTQAASLSASSEVRSVHIELPVQEAAPA